MEKMIRINLQHILILNTLHTNY